MSKKVARDTQKVISLAVLQKRPELIELLKKHGVVVSSSYTDQELIIGVLQAMRTNDRFRRDLAKLLATVAGQHKEKFSGEGKFFKFTGPSMFKFTGDNMFRFTGETMFQLSGAATAPPDQWHGADGSGSKVINQNWARANGLDDHESAHAGSSVSSSTGSKSSFFTPDKLNTLFNTGLGILSTSLANKSNKQLADKALEIEKEKTKQAELLAAANAATAGAGSLKPGLSTGAKIGIGLGIAATVGTILYFVLRKKK